jgi:hypothetical protein
MGAAIERYRNYYINLVYTRMSAWVNHVKAYSKANNVTYGEALKLAKASYQKQSGGDLKSAVRKTKNTVKRGARVVKRGARKTANFLDNHADLLAAVDENLASNAADISKGMRGVQALSKQAGGKVTAKKVVRKARNTIKRVAKIADRAAPLVGMINPEAGLAMHGASKAMTGGSCKHCGMTGGSFVTQGSGVRLGRSESSVLAATHNSFIPLKPKPLSRKLREN